MGKRSKYTFFQRRQMANRYMKRCSTSQFTRKMYIKNTIKYCLTLVRISIIKKSIAGEDIGKKEFLYAVSENINWYSYYGK